MKKNIDCLGSTLNQCAMDHKKLEFLFCKKQISHMHAPSTRHTPHLHHDHTHSHMYARVYTCTHCGCKCHLAKFYFDRLNSLNFANNNVWILNISNPHGSKKIWVPKVSPFVFDVGVGSHKT